MSKNIGSNKAVGFKALRKWFTKEGFQEEIIERRFNIDGFVKEIKKKTIISLLPKYIRNWKLKLH